MNKYNGITISLILDQLLTLQERYATTYRMIITKERYEKLVPDHNTKPNTLDDLTLREQLLEHVGHLPVIASYLHNYLTIRDKVDLGRVLTMLSIHDIAETEIGDTLTYDKTTQIENLELSVSKKLLPDYLYNMFLEMERRETLDAKFAKAVDSIAPLLHELTIPEVTVARMKHFNYSINVIVARKSKHFDWDPMLQDLFAEYLSRIEKICSDSLDVH